MNELMTQLIRKYREQREIRGYVRDAINLQARLGLLLCRLRIYKLSLLVETGITLWLI